MESQHVQHTLEPWFDEHSKVLILGTIPSPKSREYGCYYGHPQNRFWKTLAAIFHQAYPETAEQRKAFALQHHIALWDVLASCEICGAEDASIMSPQPNDIVSLLSKSQITCIFTTGKKAKELYDRLVKPSVGIEATALPSTSPANRRWCSDEALIDAYKIIRTAVSVTAASTPSP